MCVGNGFIRSAPVTFLLGDILNGKVLTDHFPFNEPRMVFDVSECINAFPTKMSEVFPFNETLAAIGPGGTDKSVPYKPFIR